MLPLVNRSPLPPSAYHDGRVLAREQERIFERHWIFVGFSDELPQNNDFLAMAIGRESVVVQDFNGQKKALRNVCSHRGARLRQHGCGHGPLRCAYHGWTYDQEGVPIGIPGNQENFGCNAEDKASLALQRFEIAAIGRFLFVRLASEGPSLSEYIGPQVREVLEKLSEVPFKQFAEGTEIWQANWKLAIGNSLEPYHLAMVHEESLGQVITGGVHRKEGRHSWSNHKLEEASQHWWQGVVKRARLSGVSSYNDYQHYLVYPNLCLGITYGTLLSVQQFSPVGPNVCSLRYRLFLPDIYAPAEEDFCLLIQDYLRDFNRRVLDEDRVPVELTQLGTAHGAKPELQGINEFRIHAFHSAIAQDLALLETSH